MRRLLLIILLMFLPAHAALALAMRITNISDLSLGTWNIGDPAIAASMDICIYGLNVPALLNYAITVSSPGGYVLKSGSQQIPYSLYWDDGGIGQLGASGGTQLSNNVTLSGRLNFNVLSDTCALTGPNARLNLKITQADMTAALAGTYTGTITLLLSPN